MIEKSTYVTQEEKISRARRICLTMATKMKTSQTDWASIEQGREKVYSIMYYVVIDIGH